jgi:hypothetical protein
VVRADEGGHVLRLAEHAASQPHGGVGTLVGPPEEALAHLDPPVFLAVHVVNRVRGSVRDRRRHQAEELVLELVGDRVSDEREVRLVGLDHVLEQRAVRLLPVQALLDVGLLADNPGFEDREVARGGNRELLATNSAKSPVNPGSPGQSGQVALARVTEVWNSRTCVASGLSSSI